MEKGLRNIDFWCEILSNEKTIRKKTPGQFHMSHLIFAEMYISFTQLCCVDAQIHERVD